MLANDGADEEYLREMKALGYQNEEVQEMMEQRGREYHGMLRLGCKRVVQPVPVPIRSVSNLRVLKVAAGYAHCMLLTDAGRLYAAGYNDRGQLGLG
jgi:alpha-tubulin suppressor-like RCC1 family protein